MKATVADDVIVKCDGCSTIVRLDAGSLSTAFSRGMEAARVWCNECDGFMPEAVKCNSIRR